LTVYFSREDDASCEPSTNHPGFTMKYIPTSRGIYDRGCYNMADLFASNFSNISTPGEPYSGVRDRVPNATAAITRASNKLNVTALNSAAFDVHANYSRIWYQQTNKSMYGTMAPGEIAARLLTVYPERGCKQGRGYPPEDIGLAPFYSWTCQSEALGECYSTPEEIQSFHISSTAEYGDHGGCFAMEARGSAAELKPGYVLSILVGSMVVVCLVL
jgi:hypothetical protein